jgi:hypothetical protein
MAIDYSVLKTELTVTNPSRYNAAFTAGDYGAVAGLLNEKQASIQISRGVVPAHEIFDLIVPSEWAALSADEKTRIQTILGMGEVNTAGTNTQNAFKAAFIDGTDTRTALLAHMTRDGSTFEQLFGAGAVAHHLDVAKAMEA